MSFQVTLPAGGTIDKVRELPYPHFSKFTVPYITGRKLDVTEGQMEGEQRDFEEIVDLPYRSEFLSVAFAASAYCTDDKWNLFAIFPDGKRIPICDNIYAKDLPESVSMGNSFGIVYPLPAGSKLQLVFTTYSTTAKKVWFNVKLLREPGSYEALK